MLKILHLNTFYFLRYAHVRYVKSLFTNIQKQQSMLKISLLLKNMQISQINNSRILRIKNAKFSGYFFYMISNIQRDFQIWISVPLNRDLLSDLPTYRLFAIFKQFDVSLKCILTITLMVLCFRCPHPTSNQHTLSERMAHVG